MKTRMRWITVGGRSYAWTVQYTGGHYGFGRQLWVWGGGKNSAPLQARMRDSPKPGGVRCVIEYGLAHDWDPDSQGPGLDTGIWEYETVVRRRRGDTSPEDDWSTLVRTGSVATGW